MTDQPSSTGRTDDAFRARIDGEIYPHRHLWHIVLANLNDARSSDPELQVPFGVAALLVIHSCFEAHLNFVGELVFEEIWDKLCRLRVPAKLELICRELSVELDRGTRPVQTVMEMNRWRNRTLHARIERYTEKRTFRHDQDIQSLAGRLFAGVTEDFVDRCQADVEQLCDRVQARAHVRYPTRFLGPSAFEGILGQVSGSILHDDDG